MQNKPELSKNEKIVYDIINYDAINNVFCYKYIHELSIKSKTKPEQTNVILKSLEEKGYIKTYCSSTPFTRRATFESERLSSKEDGFKVKYVRPKDKDLIYKALEERKLNAIKFWIYIKLISILQKKLVTTLKEIVEEISLSHEGNHSWVNSLFIKRLMIDAQLLGLAQWEPISSQEN